MKKSKIFVLDTNVILHDYRAIYHFEENDIVIPITVLEELDKFKKGNDLINYHAREFLRELDRISGDNIHDEGISLGKDKGILLIETGKEFSVAMELSFAEKSQDHRILAVANYIHQQSKDHEVILVTQDINLRMKAKSLGIKSQDYQTGKIINLDHISRSIIEFANLDDELISRLYESEEGEPIADFGLADQVKANQYFVLKGNNNSALARYNGANKHVEIVTKHATFGISPRNSEQTFALDALMRTDIKLVTLTGKAGTGKTLLALAAALQQRRDFQQIYLARPIVPLANRDMGFLPGDPKEKIAPYMQPLFDNLSVIKHQFDSRSKEYQQLDDMVRTEKLMITPLAYIRGRSLANVFFIVDEAQNLTPHEVKTIITRAGEGSKMVFTGDIQQIDSPYLDSKSNGLSYLADRMEGQNIFAHINLTQGERSYLAELASDLL